MEKKKSKNIFTSNNEYEKYFLFILSIIAIIVGILMLLDIVSFEENKALHSDNVCAVLFIVLGIIAGIISLYTIIKEIKFNKLPKPKLYEFIEQFYNEGFATTFYLKPLNYLKRKISNKRVLKILDIILKVIYTVLILIFAVFMFFKKYPL